MAVILLVIGGFGVNRWMLNHYDKTLSEEGSFEEIFRHSNKREGIYSLEKTVYDNLGEEAPWGLDADVILWIFLVAPILWYMATGFPLPRVSFGSLYFEFVTLARLAFNPSFLEGAANVTDHITVLSFLTDEIRRYCFALLGIVAVSHGLNCWYMRRSLQNTHKPSPGTAVGLTLAIPGLGQVYARHIKRGLLIQAVAILIPNAFAFCISFIIHLYGINFEVLGIPLNSFSIYALSIYSIFFWLFYFLYNLAFASGDAWHIAKKSDEKARLTIIVLAFIGMNLLFICWLLLVLVVFNILTNLIGGASIESLGQIVQDIVRSFFSILQQLVASQKQSKLLWNDTYYLH